MNIPLNLFAQESVAPFHYKPKDNVLGDVHPYFVDGECYLYSLKPKTYEVELARSRDLLHWTPVALAHEPPTHGEWKSPYYVLGVFRDTDANVYRSFYGLANGMGRIVSSVSNDLVNWACGPKAYTIPPEDNYLRRRDPFVFWIPESKEYGCVMAVQMTSMACGLGFATSANLREWTSHGIILDRGAPGDLECPQMFRFGEDWYLLASVYDRAVGQPSYWRGKSPRGPWSSKPTGVLDGPDLCAAQTAFDGDRCVLFGWIPLAPARPGVNQHWGGHLALPREVYARTDGTLATRLHQGVAKMLTGPPAVARERVRIDATRLAITGEWSSGQLELSVAMPKACTAVCFHLDALGEVMLNRAENVLAIRDPAGETGPSIPATFPTDAYFPVRIVWDDDIIEAFVNDCYTLAARLPKPSRAAALSLSAAGGACDAMQLRVSKITPGRC